MKKDIIIVTTIFVVGILIAYGLNIALTYGNLIETSIFKGSVPFSVSAAISSKPVSFGYRCKVS